LQETARRIARARGLDLAHAERPLGASPCRRLASESDLEEIRRLVEDPPAGGCDHRPAVLSLLGGGADVDPKNVFSMGPVLLEFARARL